jgi:hypothetical protein
MLVIRPGEMAAALNSWPTSANWKFQIDAGLPYLDDQRPILSPEAAVSARGRRCPSEIAFPRPTSRPEARAVTNEWDSFKAAIS